MALPDATLSIQDGGLGLLPDQADEIHVKIGAAAGGTANQVYAFGTVKAARDVLIEGPLLDALDVALNTSVNGRAPKQVLAIRGTTSTAATTGSVTKTAKSTSTGTVATTGSSPRDTYAVIIEVTRTGTLGAAAFRYSVDGGDTYSGEIAVPSGGTYTAANNGLVFVFTAGAGPIYFEAGDRFTFSTTAAAMTVANVAAAMTALFASTRPWSFVHLVGAPADAASTATLFAALATHMTTAEASKRYVFAIMEAADDTDANLISAMASSANARVYVAGGHSEIIVPSTGMIFKRSDAWLHAARIAAIPISEDPAAVASGPVAHIKSSYRNEELTPGLDAARFSTLREFVGQKPPGIYIGNGRMFAADGSDFKYVQHRRVMDKACANARALALRYSSGKAFIDPAQVDPVTGASLGRLLESSAVLIERQVTQSLRAVMGADVSDVGFRIDRTHDVLRTEELAADISALPLGYFKQITMRIGFNLPVAPATA